MTVNKQLMDGMRGVIRSAKGQLPKFFGPGRIESIRAVFDELDADGAMRSNPLAHKEKK